MDTKPDCSECHISNTSTFKTLNEEQIKYVSKNQTCVGFKKGEIIYNEGSKPTGLIFLCKGKVKIFKEGVGGRDQIIRMTRPEGIIGFRALFAEDKYIASAEVLEDALVTVLDKDLLKKLISENSDFAMQLMEKFAKELGFSSQRTVSLTQKHIRGRLAESLLFIADTYGFEDDERTINVYLSREDLANLSNMTTSNAIRTLSTFASEDVVKVDGRRISILKLEVLRKISELG
ncbi:MAG: Crp/Fnr family transcriptional regulator [Bacteroidota bacterium]|nr:Crp/Fnr family transcriptional regulator [Bacteroidota bacterium]